MTDKKYVAMFERAEGNETVGTAWIETLVVRKDTTVEQVINWAKGKHAGILDGKVILTVADRLDGDKDA